MKNHNISLSKCKKRESSRLTWSCLRRERGGGRTKHSAVRNSSSNYCLATQGACKEERATVWEENKLLPQKRACRAERNRTRGWLGWEGARSRPEFRYPVRRQSQSAW